MDNINVDFNAPSTFVDFSNMKDDSADLESYFDVDHEAAHSSNAPKITSADPHVAAASPKRDERLRDITNSSTGSVAAATVTGSANVAGQTGKSLAAVAPVSDCDGQMSSSTTTITTTLPTTIADDQDTAATSSPPHQQQQQQHQLPRTARRRSRSQCSAIRPLPLVLSETPNVLRHGMATRHAARAAALRAVQQQEQQRLDAFRRQMRQYKRAAARLNNNHDNPPQQQQQQPMKAVRTVPQPFTFHTSTVRGGAAVGGQPADEAAFKSMAQQVIDFQHKTPERFHSRPANAANSGAGAAAAGDNNNTSSVARSTTRARSPQLATRTRCRSADQRDQPLSYEQLQLRQFEQCRREAVHARPLNTLILQQTVGVPAKKRRPSTQPLPFNLTQPPPPPADQLAQGERRRSRSGPSSVSASGTRGRKRSGSCDNLLSVGPPAQRGRRSASCERQVAAESSGVPISARLITAPAGTMVGAGAQLTQNTQLQPFSFEERDKQRAATKKQRIEQVLQQERQLREFRAQLMPCVEQPRGLPRRSVKPATQPQPFHMPGLDIHQAQLEKFKHKMDEKRETEAAHRQFKAQACTVTARAAFQPSTSVNDTLSSTVTVPRAPILHSDLRAQQRRQYDLEQQQRENQAQERRFQKENELRDREQAEMARMRREAVHRPVPVPNSRAFVPAPSSQPLTEPQTPNFMRRQ